MDHVSPQRVRMNGQPAAPSLFDLSLLGGFALDRNGTSLALSMSGQRLLAYLALQDRPRARSHVAGILWADSSENQATACLRSTLWRLRRLGPTLVDGTKSHLRLGTEVRVDLRGALATCRDVLGQPEAEDSTGLDLELLTGDLLPDWDDDWVMVERERFRQLRLHALESACHRLIGLGDLHLAVQAGLATVAADPLRESGHQALIKAFLAEGNRWEAIRQYQLLRRALNDELGLEPSPELQRLVGGAGLASRAGAPRRPRGLMSARTD